MPDPAYYTDYGRWTSYAKKLLETSDSLALIAGIRKSQIRKLYAAKINSLTQFAQTGQTSVKSIPESTFSKLKAQAEIQHESQGLDKPLFRVLKDDNSKGLSALPPTSNLDVFFDIEGHPLMKDGLEYLWGVSYQNTQTVQEKQYAF